MTGHRLGFLALAFAFALPSGGASILRAQALANLVQPRTSRGVQTHKSGSKGSRPSPLPASADGSAPGPDGGKTPTGKRLNFLDGGTLTVDGAWKHGDELWYRRGGVTQMSRRQVRSIESIFAPPETTVAPATPRIESETSRQDEKSTWVYLVGGARFKVDEVIETAEGAWYRRGTLSMFLERERIARIEREQPSSFGSDWRRRDWSSGNPVLDNLIRTNGRRFGVDPYLVFLVIEQESRFHARAVSPKGARGLMQLMPGTARRFGVLHPFDPGENIRAGTRYLKELMDMFSGRVDLALASYNAGEGRVIRFGNRVPPFQETRQYVKRISERYAEVDDLRKAPR